MLQFHEVCARYGEKEVLHNVSFTLRPHRLTVLLGRNGSSKSTLLRCLNQELPYTGAITEGEKNLALMSARDRAKTVALLPQTIPAPHITAWEMAAFGRTPYLDLTGRLGEKDREAVKKGLEDADAWELRDRFVDTLSGGERQRVSLAMILAQNTPIAALDEPTSHMDQSYEAAFLRQLTAIKRSRKKTFLVILHDLTLAAEFADDLVVLDGGRAVFAGAKEDCLKAGVLEETFDVKCYKIVDNGEEKLFFAAK